MNILLMYATYSSGTSMAAQTVADTLTNHSHTVTVKLVEETDPSEFAAYDLVILASPSWDYEGKEGQPHQHYVAFIKKLEGQTMPGKKFAVFGLGDSSYIHFCGAVDELEKFVKALQGTLVVQSLRIDGYFFDQDTNTQKLVSWADTLNTTLTK